MKLKVVIIFLISVSSFLSAFGQTLRLGSGATFSKFRESGSDKVFFVVEDKGLPIFSNSNYNYGLGVSVSAIIDLPIKSKFSISSGATFSIKRIIASAQEISLVNIEGESLGHGDLLMKSNLNYLIFPLKMKIILGRKKKGFITGGAFYGLLFSNKYSVEIGEGQFLNGKDFSESRMKFNSISKSDFGLSGGFGILLKKIQISISHEFGFQNLLKDEQISSSLSFKSRSTNLTVSYEIWQKKTK